MTLLVHLMGSVRLVRDGEPVAVGGPKQQVVLAVLALSAGRRVSTDRLVDVVWGENPPASARRTVQSYVASLRRALGAGAALEPSQNGYTLDVERSMVDLLAFEDQAAELLADVGLDIDDRAERLADVLSSWETPMDGIRGTSRLHELSAPFEELRCQAVEGLAAAQIAGTRAGDAVRMLEALVREYPTRENLWLELARGLSRLGRRDAALVAIQRAREALREHLGVHPSDLLSALETDLLTDDDVADSGSGLQAALPNSNGRPHRLPQSLSSFLGRVAEIDDVARLLSQERLVTLRGLGGIGKTSLALRVATDQASDFDDGVWFVDVAYVAPAGSMSEKFLAAIGLRPRADTDPLDQLLTQLSPLRALLVVDNCEGHVDEISEVVGRIVHAAPDVHVLATSRSSLAVAGGAVWQVGPLDISTAVDLFAERARVVRRNFVLSDTNRRIAETICEKLDGIPLAIELAAARLNVLGLDQILEHLDDRFALLTDRTHVRRDDERMLQSALDWSYGLLDEHERSLLRRLTVFPVGFTLESANEICADGESVVGLVRALGVLVEASLVVFDADGDADPRYRLLETVREYAAAKLTASERDEVALRHAAHFVDVASRFAAQRETDHLGALRVVDRDLDNLRAAMACAFAYEQPEWGLSIARHLSAYFFSRQLNREFLRWLQVGIDQADPASDEALLALAFALIAADNSNYVEATGRLAEQVERGIGLAQSTAVRARLLTSHAAHLMDIDPRAADKLLADATELLRPIDGFAIIACIHNRLEIAWRTGDLPHADEMASDLDDLPDRPIVRRERVLLEIHVAACAGEWEQVIAVSLEHDGLDEETSTGMLLFRAEALGALGRIDEAIATLDRVDALDPYEDLAQTNSQILRTTAELRRGGAVTARSLMAESGALFSRDSDRVQRTWLGALAGVAAHQLGDDETAALLFGHARAIAAEFDVNLRMSERPLVEQATRQCRASLGPDRFDELANLGASSDWAELVGLLQPT